MVETVPQTPEKVKPDIISDGSTGTAIGKSKETANLSEQKQRDIDGKKSKTTKKLFGILYSDVKSSEFRIQVLATVVGTIIIAIMIAMWGAIFPTHTFIVNTTITTTITSLKPYIALISDISSQFPKNAILYIANPSNLQSSSFAFYFRTSNYSDATLSVINNDVNITFPYGNTGSNIYVLAQNIKGGAVGAININFTRLSNITTNVTETDANYCNTTFFANYYPIRSQPYQQGDILLSKVGNCSSLILSKFQQTFLLKLNLSGPPIAYSKESVLGISGMTNNGLLYTINAIKQNSSDYSYWVDGLSNRGYWYREGIIFNQTLNNFYGVHGPFLATIQIWNKNYTIINQSYIAINGMYNDRILLGMLFANKNTVVFELRDRTTNSTGIEYYNISTNSFVNVTTAGNITIDHQGLNFVGNMTSNSMHIYSTGVMTSFQYSTIPKNLIENKVTYIPIATNSIIESGNTLPFYVSGVPITSVFLGVAEQCINIYGIYNASCTTSKYLPSYNFSNTTLSYLNNIIQYYKNGTIVTN